MKKKLCHPCVRLQTLVVIEVGAMRRDPHIASDSQIERRPK